MKDRTEFYLEAVEIITFRLEVGNVGVINTTWR